MKTLIIISFFLSSFVLCAQNCSEVRTYLDSTGKKYKCIVDHSGEIVFIKTIYDDTATYEFVLFHKDSVLREGKKGVVIFLKNNTRMIKNEAKVKLEISDIKTRRYVYTTTIILDKDDLNKLLLHSITSVSVADMYMNVYDGEDYKNDLFCLYSN